MLGKWGVTNCYLYSRPTVFLMDSTIYVCNYKGIWLATNSNSLMMKKFTLTSYCFRSNFPIYHKALIKISFITTPVGINEKGFVNSDFGMFLLLDYCIENERGSVGTPLCRVLLTISSKSSKIVYFSQNCYFHVM